MLPGTSAAPHLDRCVFLIGCDRSGTTLLRSILNRHPSLGITYEAPASVMLQEVFASGGYRATIEALRTFPQFDLVNWSNVRDTLVDLDRVTLADTVATAHRSQNDATSKTIWGDKTPAYTRFVSTLAAMYPNSVFIHIVRDPRAVAMSWIATDWGPNTALHAGIEWTKRVSQAIDGFSQISSSRCFTARYEDLVSDPLKTLDAICHLVGIDYSDELIKASDAIDDCLPGEYFKQLHSRCGKEMDPSRLQRWKQMDSHSISLIEAGCWDLMKQFDYDPVQRSRPTVSKFDAIWCRAKNKARRSYNDWRRRSPAPAYPLPS